MALDMAAIREALATQIYDRLSGSNRPASVYDYPPDSPELPAVLIRPRTGTPEYIQYHQSFSQNVQGDGALAGIELEVEVRVGGWDVDSHRAMDDYLSTGTEASVINAIEADPTLGGALENCWVRAVAAPVSVIPADGVREWLSAKFEFVGYERR